MAVSVASRGNTVVIGTPVKVPLTLPCSESLDHSSCSNARPADCTTRAALPLVGSASAYNECILFEHLLTCDTFAFTALRGCTIWETTAKFSNCLEFCKNNIIAVVF